MFNKNEVASFDVDAQKGFTPLCPNELPVPDGDKIVDELNAQARFASRRIGSKDAHPMNPIWLANEEHPVLSPIVGQKNADVYWPSHCVVGTKGFELLDGLPDPSEYDFFIWKGMERHIHPYGACFHDIEELSPTGVCSWLHKRGITAVIVGGLATEYCVATTCKQLMRSGFTVIINKAACRGLKESDVYMAHQELRKFSNFIWINQAKDLKGYIKL